MTMSYQTPSFENLEPRLLLTTLVGGETFEYADVLSTPDDPHIIRITLQGDIVAEFIGCQYDYSNSVLRLGDLAGEITLSDIGRSGVEILGGIGGADGSDIVGPITGIPLSRDDLLMNALASAPALGNGDTYGFTVATVGDVTEVKLWSLDVPASLNGNVAANEAASLQSVSCNAYTSIPAGIVGQAFAVAVNPTNGYVYTIDGNSDLRIYNQYDGSLISTYANLAGGTISGVQAMTFNNAGDELFVIGWDGTHQQIVQLDLTNPDNAPLAAVDIYYNDPALGNVYYSNSEVFTGMAFNSSGDLYAAYTSGSASYRVRFTGNYHTVGATDDTPLHTNNIIVSGTTNTTIQDICFYNDIKGNEILVGIDLSLGANQAQLLNITALGNIGSLTAAGGVADLYALSKYLSPTDTKPMLYSASSTDLYRGSVMFLEGVEAIQAASFHPYVQSVEDGLLYFVARQKINDITYDLLYSIDVTQFGATAKQNSLTLRSTYIQSSDTYISLNGGNDEVTVTSIAWDITSNTSATLWGYQKTNDSGFLFTINPATGATSNPIEVWLLEEAGGEAQILTDITGIEFINDNVNTSEPYIVAVSGTNLVRINTTGANAGGSYVLGPIIDKDDTISPFAGSNVQGLTWNPMMVNPFTGTYGVLLGTDVETDEVIVIDYRARFAPGDDIFAIYVSQASAGSSISIARVDADDPARYEMPFDENVENLWLINAQSGDITDTPSPDGMGGVWIGGRYIRIINDVKAWQPVIDSSLPGQIGVRAEFINANDSYDITSGVVVTENLLDWLSTAADLPNKLLGRNLDDVREIAVRNDGSIYVVDSDFVDQLGQPVAGDQIASVNANGRASTPITIKDIHGNPLSNIGALAYGDRDPDTGQWLVTGNQTLYAVYNINNPVPVDSIGGSLGVTGADFVALTVTRGGQMYAINNDGVSFSLYRIDRGTDGALTGCVLLGTIATPTGAEVLEIAALEADPDTGTLYIVGYHDTVTTNQTLYTLDLAPQNIGGVDCIVAQAIGSGLDAGTLVAANITSGLAFLKDSLGVKHLYAAIFDGTDYQLYELDYSPTSSNAGEGTLIGVIADEDGDANCDIRAMDADSEGHLYALDDNPTTGNRVIQINTTTPNESYLVSSNFDDDLVGYTFDAYDIGYSIYDNSLVWESPGEIANLGTITVSSNSAVFTAIAPIQNTNTVLSGVNTMAFKHGTSTLQPSRDALYVVDGNNYLWEVNAQTGAIVSKGYRLVDSNSDVVIIESMDFEGESGEKTLYGFDPEHGRLVDISLDYLQPYVYGSYGTLTVGSHVATTNGSMRPTVAGLAYDSVNERFLTVDNSMSIDRLESENYVVAAESAAVMVLKGFEAYAQNIGSILIGGAVTGNVDISGNVDGTFYAGWLITGDTLGQAEGTPVRRENFKVGGDLRNLVVNKAIGTLDGSALDAPVYVTGFDAVVTGKIGQVWTLDSMIASYFSENVANYLIPHDDSLTYQQEIEYIPDPGLAHPEGDSFEFEHRLFRADGAFFNDTFETAQYLGTMGLSSGLAAGVIELRGRLAGEWDDEQDFYGISLLAGQTISVRGTYYQDVCIGVLDPDGRLIATDTSDVDAASVFRQEFRFTADKAGVYRIAIGQPPFDGTGDVPDNGTYTIYLSAVGNLAIGGVKANVDYFNQTSEPSIHVMHGDMGGVYTGGTLFFQGPQYTGNIIIETGSLRSIDASKVGIGINNNEFGINLIVGQHIGMLRSRVEQLNIESAVIGGNLQLVDAMTDFFIDLNAGGGIGVIRAGTMATASPSRLWLDTDGVGNDGIIDLIDIAGDMGTNPSGGAQISFGPDIYGGDGYGDGEGDVRYMRVGGLIFQDIYYGWGDYNGVTLAAGESAVITDDSGATITLSPQSVKTNAVIGGPWGVNDTAFLTYRTYGIRGSGGSVLVDITSSGGFVAAANANGVGSGVHIGKITAQGEGRAVIADPKGGLMLTPQASPGYNQDLNVILRGSVDIDVFEIIGGNFSTISNGTGGEIVNVVANSIGTLYAYGSIGLAKNSTGQAVDPRVDLLATNAFIPVGYPFLQQHIGVVVNGNVEMIASRSSVGNIMVNGQIEKVIANDGQNINLYDGEFRGIDAPIFATGDIYNVYIGEGIAPSGNGSFAHSGVFSLGEIWMVCNNSAGGDIRGAVVGQRGVRNVILTNGSIINADIIAGLLPSALEYTGMTLSADIGTISVSGTGGIIGMQLAGQNIGSINVKNGFGLFNSDIYTVDGNGSIGNTTVDGYGIRMVMYSVGGNQGNITATGRGAEASSLNYSPSARYSETETWLPGTDQRLSRLNDIHLFLGTTAAAPLDRQGLLQDIYAHGNGNLGVVSGYRITTWRGTFADTRMTTFDFANSIAGFTTYAINASDTATNSIDGLEITTGKLGYFNPAQDVNSLQMTIAGLISNITIRGSLLGTSSISAMGPNGNINKLTILGQMQGNVTSNGIIGVMTVGGDMTGNIVVDPILPVKLALNKLTINGSFNGTFDVNGNVGTITVGADLGVAGDTLRINGNLGTLTTGKLQAGSDMALDLNVLGNVGKMLVYGAMSGDAWIDGNLSMLSVTNAGNPITGDLTVMGTLSKATITGDNWASAMIAGNAIGSVTITGGDLALGASIICLQGDINLISIRGGDLFGTVSAPNGVIGKIIVTGSDLGAASLIEAGQLNLLQIDGSILSGARIVVDDQLTTLKIGGDVQAGSTINVGSIRTLTVNGSLMGDFTLGYNSYGTYVNVRGNLGSAGSVFSADADLRLIVSNILDGATIAVARNLTLLQVTGQIAGNVFVDGSITTLKAGSLNTAVIVSGMDMNSVIITGAVTSSLVQAGINRGDDNDFASLDDNGSQIARMGEIKRLQVGSANLSIFAAGGHIGSAVVNGALADSSISSGMVLSGVAINTIIGDPAQLNGIGKLYTARGNVTLLWGNFGTATVKGLMTNSDLSAGVDPGADGEFNPATDLVSTSQTGGNSSFSSVTALYADAASTVVADAGLGRARIGNALSNGNVTYDIADILGGDPLETHIVPVSPVSQTHPMTVPFNGITITVTGQGSVDVYYTAAGAITADIDSLVIRDTNSKTKIEITGGGSIGRILTADDTVVGTLTYDGTLLGVADPDVNPNVKALWLDAGKINTLSLEMLDANVRGGRIGGDVASLYLGTQGAGQLRVGGSINVLQIDQGEDPLLNELGKTSTATKGAIAVDDDPGTTWVFDVNNKQIQYWNIEADGSDNATLTPGSSVHVYTYLNANPADNTAPLTITAMDMKAAGGDLLAVAQTWSLSPTVSVGAIGNTTLTLEALAILNNGSAYAIENAGAVALPWDMDQEYTDVITMTVGDDGTQYVLRYEEINIITHEMGYTLYTVGVTVAGHTLVALPSLGSEPLRYDGVKLDNIDSMDFYRDEDNHAFLSFIGTRTASTHYKLYSLDIDSGTPAEKNLYESDTIVSSSVELAYINVSVLQPTWQVDDLVQNGDGTTVRWTGKIITADPNQHDFVIQIMTGTFQALHAGTGEDGTIKNNTHDTGSIQYVYGGCSDGVQIQTLNAHAGWAVSDVVSANDPLGTGWQGTIDAISGGNQVFNIRLYNGDYFTDIIRAEGIKHAYDLTTTGGTINGAINALTVTSDGSINAIWRDEADTHDTLVGLDLRGVFYNTNIGTVQIDVDGVTTNTEITGMDFDAGGNILALDTNGGYRVVRVNVLTPSDSWVVDEDTIYDGNTKGFTSTTSGEFYSFEIGGAGVDAGLLKSLGRDRLVQINTATGAQTVVGSLRDIYGNFYYDDVYEIAGDDNGLLYAVLKDSDGMGNIRSIDDGAALARIATAASSGGTVRVSSPNSTTLPPLMVYGGDEITDFTLVGGSTYQITTDHSHKDWIVGDLVRNDTGTSWSGTIASVVDTVNYKIFTITNNDPTNPIDVVEAVDDGVKRMMAANSVPASKTTVNAMAVDSNDTIYIVSNNGTSDWLYEVGTNGEVSLYDSVMIGGTINTTIIGMGFDSYGNLVAYNNDGTNAGLINLSDPTSADRDLNPNQAVRVTAWNVLDPNIDAFAIGRSGASGFTAYAYDYDNAVGGMFYKSPGLVATLGTINHDQLSADYGRFTQLMPLAKQADGVGLTSAVTDVSYVDANNVYVITADGRLYRYNDQGDLLAVLGPVKDAATLENLSLTKFDYNGTDMIAIDGTYNQLVTLHTNVSNFSQIGALDSSAVDNQNFLDLTINSSGMMYALQAQGASYQLYRVARDSNGNVVGCLAAGSSFDTIQAINSIEADPASTDGLMYFIGRPAAGTTQALYTINTAGVVAKVKDLKLFDLAFTYDVKALCFSGSTLYFVANNGTADTLYRVNTSSGDVTEVFDTDVGSGAILVGGAPATIKSMDAGADGSLTAVAEIAGSAYMIRIDVKNPSASVNLSNGIAINNTNRGLAIDASNRFYMVLPVASEDDQVVCSTASTTDARMEPGSVDAADLTDLSYEDGTFYTFSKSRSAFAELNGTTQENQYGITVESINNLYLGNDYAGRIVATGNTFKNVVVNGDFSGTLYTAGLIQKFTQTGNFSGTLYGAGGMGTITINGAMLDGGLVATPGYLNSLRITGLVSGGVSASRAGTLTFGAIGATADVRVSLSVNTVLVGGTLTGSMEFGSVGNFTAIGSDSANVQIHGNAGTIRLNAGTNVGSYLKVDGTVSRLYVYGTHSGVIAVDEGATTIQMATVANGFLVVGNNVKTLTVTGNVTSSVLSIGTTIGADGVYNTEDDRITGGVLTTATLRGNFINSALVAGVLPNLSYGPGLPAEMWYYTGNNSAANLEDIDSAEVGGVLPSAIGRVTIFGTTGTFAGGDASAIASESLGAITRRNPWSNLYTRSYVDPVSPPATDWDSMTIVSTSEVKIYFTEEINTSSLILSIDIDDDGYVTGATDTLGSVTITNNTTGEIIDDATLSYTKETDENGNVHGVLHIFKANLFAEKDVNGVDTNLSVVLSGTNPAAILGLSGMRSSRRNMVDTTAPMGTILDGNNNGVEGGDTTIHYGEYNIAADVPDYEWWFGCAPTAAGMIMGYYDGKGFGELIDCDDASTQTDEVNDAIATSGTDVTGARAEYLCNKYGYQGTGPNGPAVAGTGSIGDYAIYNGVDDSGDNSPYPDLSDPAVGGTPHASNCLADFMMTSWSINGSTMGGTSPVYIGAGMTEYVDWVNSARSSNYSSIYEYLNYGTELTLGTLAGEIANGRPVLLGVDSNGDGAADHAITVVGYNFLTNEYLCYTTYKDGIKEKTFAPVGNAYGVYAAVTFQISKTNVA